MSYKDPEQEKIHKREYNQRPEIKKHRKEYSNSPKAIAYRKAYKQRPEVKAHTKEYNSRSEVKLRNRISMNNWRSRPENKIMKKIYDLKFHKDYDNRLEIIPHKREYHRQYQTKYRERPNIKAYKKWYDSLPETKRKNKDRAFRKKYNITFQDFEQMLKNQNNKCKICTLDLVIGGTRRNSALVDHDHKAEILYGIKRVRGLLCNNCNAFIGLALEDTHILKRAIEYLEKEGKV